jgi:3-hydroxyacyl-CoA dehydrogenase
MNAIDDGIIEMLSEGLDYAERDGKALVVANDGEHFSAGANIFLIAMLAQQKAFDKIEEVVGLFQKANIRFKYAKVPVVSAPFNYTFGGGAEIVLASSGVCAHAELYIGLVEVGVGLIPGGGGNSQFLVRARELVESKQINPGPMPTVQKAFETIGFAKVATSAQQAVNFGFLRPTDKYIMDRSRVLGEAKKMALELAEDYQPPEVPTFNLPGTHGRLALEYGIDGFVRNGVISEHDKKIGYKLARVLTGGDVHPTDTVTEQQLLDLEREAFVSLTGEQKTLDRIQHMLMKGKPLRN